MKDPGGIGNVNVFKPNISDREITIRAKSLTEVFTFSYRKNEISTNRTYILRFLTRRLGV